MNTRQTSRSIQTLTRFHIWCEPVITLPLWKSRISAEKNRNQAVTVGRFWTRFSSINWKDDFERIIAYLLRKGWSPPRQRKSPQGHGLDRFLSIWSWNAFIRETKEKKKTIFRSFIEFWDFLNIINLRNF